MEYQKIINLLENTPNQPTKFRTIYQVEINDESRETRNSKSQIKFKISILKSSLCDYSDAYILVKETITIAGAGADHATKRLDEKNKGVIFKNFLPFTDCINEIINTQINNAKDIDVVIPMYNLME